MALCSEGEEAVADLEFQHKILSKNQCHEIIVYSTPAKKVYQERKKDTISTP